MVWSFPVGEGSFREPRFAHLVPSSPRRVGEAKERPGAELQRQPEASDSRGGGRIAGVVPSNRGDCETVAGDSGLRDRITEAWRDIKTGDRGIVMVVGVD
jgi:hypothetical protein